MTLTAPRVLILEDHEIVASAVVALLEEQLPGTVTLRSNTFSKGLELLEKSQPVDLVILDVNLPGGGNISMLTALRDIQPGVKILIFTGQEDHRIALQFLSAGANGFLTKDSSEEEIGLAITKVLAGRKYMTEAIQQSVAESFFNKIDPRFNGENTVLSGREQQVMELLLEGKQTKQIAQELDLKLTTVSTHKGRIFEKMQVTNVIELFRKLNPTETE
ncbi:DNA-binding NarL/FixJ family response regulator [Dyadobacter jejuensis]|uniref:DNA-binding NarL/FixJ family response regulator n=1 Tax=Dyadobacter jejuensis TaxID=1082580 RepID=A0A316AH00_9BACT|nr:response regulator transcription factor [Dyadobacter jejuensis]PWJ56921.1 DNA-binding NarL/FixJ family response regulator [Dyadobacter jejuensis]